MSSDRVTDSLGRGWQLGTRLGRGSWGQSRVVRDPNGREAVLKVPLGAADGADAEATAAIAREQVEFIQENAFGLAASERAGATGVRVQSPRLEATVDLGGGAVGLLFPRYPSLERRLESGLPLSEALAVVHRIAASLSDAGRMHGNLKPSNVLFGERGEILLSDPCTPTFVARVAGLRAADGPLRAFLPPEAGTTRVSPGWDTWALCQVVWASIQPQHQTAEGGVDKLGVAAAKDRAHAAFATEGSNPRFRGRVSDRLGALLSRGLSADRQPSPPYRFESLRELSDRLAEVIALVRPRVVDVGRLLPPASAKDAVFTEANGLVSFSVTVGGTPGVADADDLVCGLQLTDLDKTDAEGRPLRLPVDDADVDVAAHPSGRLRFQFSIPAVRPGRYRLRVAFAVKDGGDEPQVATGDFEVRPPPGYVPPPAEPTPAPSALPFPRTPRIDAPLASAPTEERLTDPGEGEVDVEPASDPDLPGRAPSAPDEDATPVGAIVRFPKPIAPPDEEDEDHPTVQVKRMPLVFATADDPASDPVPRFQPLPAPTPRDDEGLDTEELLADTADVPRSTVSAPMASVITLPTARPAPPSPTPAPPPAVRADPPSIAPPAMLGEGPATEPDDVPGGEDLPGYGARGSAWRGTVVAALEILRRDRYLSVGVAIALCLLLVLTLTLLLKAC